MSRVVVRSTVNWLRVRGPGVRCVFLERGLVSGRAVIRYAERLDQTGAARSRNISLDRTGLPSRARRCSRPPGRVCRRGPWPDGNGHHRLNRQNPATRMRMPLHPQMLRHMFVATGRRRRPTRRVDRGQACLPTNHDAL